MAVDILRAFSIVPDGGGTTAMNFLIRKSLTVSIARVTPQPLTAWLVSAIALVALVAFWQSMPSGALAGSELQIILLAVCLSSAVVIGDMYPIHVNYHTKASVSTVSLYLMAVLLPPPIAALAAGASILTAELVRPAKGNYASDTATCVSRWIVTILITSYVAQWSTLHSAVPGLVLVTTAVVMYLCDVVSSGLELGPIINDRPSWIALATIRATWSIDIVLYALGIVAALVSVTHVWALVFLIPPLYTTYTAFKQTKEMRDSTHELLEGMADAVDLRDPYTGGHSRRVTALTAQILRELHLSGPDVAMVITAARVHDIGKIGIPDSVLHKTDKLTPEEWAIMETHPGRGAEMLARYSDFARGVRIVRHHHERWDGRGYPDKLAGLDIPFGSRVIAVADSYDAMTKRPALSEGHVRLEGGADPVRWARDPVGCRDRRCLLAQHCTRSGGGGCASACTRARKYRLERARGAALRHRRLSAVGYSVNCGQDVC